MLALGRGPGRAGHHGGALHRLHPAHLRERHQGALPNRQLWPRPAGRAGLGTRKRADGEADTGMGCGRADAGMRPRRSRCRDGARRNGPGARGLTRSHRSGLKRGCRLEVTAARPWPTSTATSSWAVRFYARARPDEPSERQGQGWNGRVAGVGAQEMGAWAGPEPDEVGGWKGAG